MGNRAIITTPERKIGLYLHWNGGRDTVEPLLHYCELKGYHPPSTDCYGWARLAQVVGNFFGGTTSVGVCAYTDDRKMNPGDNGIYVIEGWGIVERIYPYESFTEQNEHGFDEILHALDESMPEDERLGGFLDSVEIPTSKLKLGDKVWIQNIDGHWSLYPVVDFDSDNTPLVARYDHDGDWSWNPNNRITEETIHIVEHP